MNIVTLFGIVTTIIGVMRALPQLVRILRARHANGVSVDTAATSMAVSAGWVAYGALTRQPAISLASAATSLIFALITGFALHYGRKLNEFKIAPLWMIVLILAGALGGAFGLSLVLLISVLVANTPQIWLTFHETNLAELSLGTWLLSLTEGLIWGSYGIFKRDMPVLVNNSFQIITSLLIVVQILLYQQNLRKAVRVEKS